LHSFYQFIFIIVLKLFNYFCVQYFFLIHSLMNLRIVCANLLFIIDLLIKNCELSNL